jgi:CheY-like chemotaxis protein
MTTPGHNPSAPPARKAKILVVDDEAPIRELESQVLAALGYEVIAAESGEEALLVARTQLPDLVLLDVRMPGISGIEVCQQLRSDKLTRDLRIIVVTGLDAKTMLEESIIAGADDFLAKPVDPLELSVRVRSMLRVRNIHDEEKRLEAYVKQLQALRPSKKD